MYDERKAWLAKGGEADNDSKDVLTLLSGFSERWWYICMLIGPQ